MMWAMMMWDWFECQDCTDKRTSELMTEYAWTLSESRWDKVYSCLYEVRV